MMVKRIVLLPKPEKAPNNVKSYCPVNLLPVTLKLCEKLLLKILKSLLIELIAQSLAWIQGTAHHYRTTPQSDQHH